MGFNIYNYFKEFSKNRDVSNNKLLHNFDSVDLMKDVCDKLDKTSSMLTVVGYRIDIVNSDDKEMELIDHRFKNDKDSERNGIDKITYNIDKTRYYKLTILIEVTVDKIQSKDPIKRNQLIQNNNAYINLMRNRFNTIDRPYAQYKEGSINTVVPVDIWIPVIEYAYCEISDNLYYLSFKRIRNMEFTHDNKLKVQRLSVCKTSRKMKSSKVEYYHLAIVDGEMVLEVFKGVYNLYNVYKFFGLDTTRLHELAKKYPCIQKSIDNYTHEHITIVDFDKNLDNAVEVLIGESEITPYKYYRYGSVIHEICSVILTSFIEFLPRANGQESDRYFDANDDDIIRMKEDIQKSIHSDKVFGSVMRGTKQGELKNTTNEDTVMFPVKLHVDEHVERVFLEDDMEKHDPYGTSQTTNVLKIQSINLFVDEKLID